MGDSMRAIVLSGGGARGSYQIGVWKALRKLNIKYNIVVGTSVGALNGAFMVQGNYKDALKMWENMNFDLIFSDKFDEQVLTKNSNFELFKTYAKGILMNGGMDVSRMEATMDRYINLDVFYQSKIDFGMVTVNLSNLKPITITKDQIPKGKLKDYLMASATCFPAFKIKRIDGDMYVDGGYYDNFPINLALDMGADEIIGVDLDAVGLKKKLKKVHRKVNITYIGPKNNIGNFLIFDASLAKRGIAFGYNDTLKVFHKLDGDLYTFKKNHIRYSYLKNHRKIEDELKRILESKHNITKELIKHRDYQKIWNQKEEWQDLYLRSLEYLAKTLELEEVEVYSLLKFNRQLKKAFAKVERLNFDLIERKMKERKVRGLIHNKYVIRYIYELLMESKKSDIVKDKLRTVALILPKEFLATLYLSVLK